jgi:hypothetical protein
MRPINLIPDDQRRRLSGATRTGPLAYIIVGALGVLLIGVVMLVSLSNQISDREGEAETLEARKTAIAAKADALAPYVSFQNLARQRIGAVTELANSRFDWERVIRELSLTLPPTVFILKIDASVSGSAEGASEGGVAGTSFVADGCAVGQDGTAEFVAGLRQIDGVTRVGLAISAYGEAASSAGEGCPNDDEVQFTVTVAFDEAPTSVIGEPTVVGEVAPEEATTEEGSTEATAEPESTTTEASTATPEPTG